MAINWGNLGFEEIVPLDAWNPPKYGGIYAITFRPDYKNKPSTYRVIYFGETDKFDGRGISDSHHKFSCWKEKANENRLYVSIHRDDNDINRKNKEKKLIVEYTPSCNDEYT
jgi:hypothetical protein